MRHSQMLAFLAVAEHGSIRAAARALDLSQPAMSQIIRRLEDELGVSLFDRSNRGIRLTPYGKALRTRAALIRSELNRSRDEIEQLKGTFRGEVRIGLITSISLLFAPRALNAFSRKFPNAFVRIVDQFYDNALAALRGGELDFAIGPKTRTLDSGLKGQFLFRSKRAVIVRKGHPCSDAKTLAELTGHKWVEPVDGEFDQIASLFQTANLPCPHIIRCRSLSTWLPLVLENDGIIVLPRHILQSRLLHPMLIALDIKEITRASQYYLFTNADTSLTPAADFLAKQFRLATRGLSVM